jgi:hypothetical protein
MNYDIVDIIANISIALSFIVAVILGIFQVRQAARDRREHLTMEILRSIQSREFAELTGQISYHKVPSDYKDFMSLTLREQAKYIQFSQEMEVLGISVAERLVDIDLVDKTLGSFVTSSWQNYKVIFEELRLKQSDPFLGEYFQWLAEYMNNRMQKKLRKPFHEVRRGTI